MDCNRYRAGLIEAARGLQTGARDDGGLALHLRECAHCESEFRAQKRLSEIARRVAAEATFSLPHLEPNAALLAAFDAAAVRRQPRVWWLGAGVAAGVAAAVLFGWVLWQSAGKSEIAVVIKPVAQVTAGVLTPPPGGPPPPTVTRRLRVARHPRKQATEAAPEADQPFVAIPFTAPLGPDERAEIVRMDLPVSALIAAGLRLQVSDPGASARADLVVGEDGRARAVRLISVSNFDF